MDARTNSQGIAAAPLGLFAAYWGDMLWRTVASGEALRQRANNMTEHEAAGMPPLLHFESEQVADGHDLQPASNYRLLRVTRCGGEACAQRRRAGAGGRSTRRPRPWH